MTVEQLQFCSSHTVLAVTHFYSTSEQAISERFLTVVTCTVVNEHLNDTHAMRHFIAFLFLILAYDLDLNAITAS